MLDDGQHILALTAQRHGLEGVAGQDHLGLAAQQYAPCGGCPLGCRIDACVLEDLPYRRSGDFDAEHRQLALNSPVAPAGILVHRAQHEPADRGDGARLSGVFSPAVFGVAPPRQVAVPP